MRLLAQFDVQNTMGYSILMYEILQVSGGGVRQSKLITHPLRNEARALMKPVALPLVLGSSH